MYVKKCGGANSSVCLRNSPEKCESAGLLDQKLWFVLMAWEASALKNCLDEDKLLHLEMAGEIVSISRKWGDEA